MQTLLQDIRYGLRTLRRTPGLTIVVALTIAIGVGVNTATFSLVNGFIIRPMPVPQPQQIVALPIQEANSALGALGFSYPEFADFRQQAAGSCDMFGQAFAGGGVTFGGRTDQASFSAVTSNFFSGMGVKPALGRLILPSEGEKPGEPATLVLGYRYWKKRFGGDRDIVGKQVQLNGKPVEIIGVVPKEFHGMFSPFEMDGYLPLSTAFPRDTAINFWNDRNKRLVTSLARLKPGVTMAQAQSLFDVISRREAEQHPASDKGFSVHVLPEKMARPIPYANSAFLVISALFLVLSAIVLLLACTNVANILMARASLRAREMAIRTALGGGRVRLIRQMLTETLLVTFLGGSLGLLLSSWMGGLISSIHFPNAPIQFDTSFDWRVFAYAFAVVLFAGVFAGFSFALQATKTDVNAGLQQSNRTGSSRHKVRKDLMVLQLAGSMTLLVIAGLFLRSLQNAERLNLGFNPEHVLNVALYPQINNYTEAQTKEFYQRLEATVRPMPGVQAVSLASSVPITSFPSRDRVYLEGRASSDHQLPSILFNRVDPSYFQTMQIPLLLGRDFLDSDNEGAAPVAIVNQTMANRLWPGQQPIGKRFSMGHETGPFLEVVGVARDSKYQTIAEDPQPYFYVPLAQSFVPLQILQIRSLGKPEALSSQIQQQTRALDPAITIVDIRTMNESLGGATGFFMFRLGASIAAFMGILGLLLAVIGVYGMVSYATTQRTQEIGVRVALGADQKQILRLIIGQGMRIACIGIGIGLLAAWGLTRLTRHMLIGISASDPALYLEVATLVSIVALLACYIPARRAAKVDPMVALRYE